MIRKNCCLVFLCASASLREVTSFSVSSVISVATTSDLPGAPQWGDPAQRDGNRKERVDHSTYFLFAFLGAFAPSREELNFSVSSVPSVANISNIDEPHPAGDPAQQLIGDGAGMAGNLLHRQSLTP